MPAAIASPRPTHHAAPPLRLPDFDAAPASAHPPQTRSPFLDPTPTDPIPPSLLSDLADPKLSFYAVAERHNTTVDALSLFLIRPGIAETVNTLEDVVARRARLVVSVSLTEIAGSLLKQLHAANADLDSPTPPTLLGFSLRLRARESIRKSASLLLRIGRFDPASKIPSPAAARPTGASESPTDRPVPSEAPSPREAVAEGRPNVRDQLTALQPKPPQEPLGEQTIPAETPDITPFITALRKAEPSLFQNRTDQDSHNLVTRAIFDSATSMSAEQFATLSDEAVFALVLNQLRSSPGP